MLSHKGMSHSAEEKPAALLHLLRATLPREQPTLVFVATRHHVEFLHGLLAAEGLETTYVYGSMDQVRDTHLYRGVVDLGQCFECTGDMSYDITSQSARKINTAKFRSGKCSVMLVTDVAARGIDIPLLDNVINYDFPPRAKLFVHRAGLHCGQHTVHSTSIIMLSQVVLRVPDAAGQPTPL